MTKSGSVKASVTNIGKSTKAVTLISVGTIKNVSQRNGVFRGSVRICVSSVFIFG